MKLYGTLLSHFARKPRILLDLYSVDYEFVDIGNIVESPKENFGGNPLARVPVLADGDEWLIDSDQIAEYIVSKVDPDDRYQVLHPGTPDRNVRTVLNGIMSEEVTIIVAQRTGVPIERFRFFDDSREAIQDGLAWLEARWTDQPAKELTYLEIHLACLWEHLDYLRLIPLEFPRLKSVVERVLAHPKIRATSPYVSRPRSDPNPAVATGPDAFVREDRFGRFVGARLVSVNESECVYEYEVNPAHFNPNNILHGGVLFSVMDSSQGMLVHFPPKAAGFAATGTATIRYLAPVRQGKITVRTRIDRWEGRKGFVVSEAFSDDGALVARLEEIWIRMKEKTG
jgi:uncharacterized protein (TIGR00369 family)